MTQFLSATLRKGCFPFPVEGKWGIKCEDQPVIAIMTSDILVLPLTFCVTLWEPCPSLQSCLCGMGWCPAASVRIGHAGPCGARAAPSKGIALLLLSERGFTSSRKADLPPFKPTGLIETIIFVFTSFSSFTWKKEPLSQKRGNKIWHTNISFYRLCLRGISWSTPSSFKILWELWDLLPQSLESLCLLGKKSVLVKQSSGEWVAPWGLERLRRHLV